MLTRKYDLVHGFGHRPTVSIPAFLHRLIYRTPYIADWCDLWGKGGIAGERHGLAGMLVGWFDEMTESFVYRRATAVTVISTYLQRRMQKSGFPEENIFRLPAGSPVDVIHPQPYMKFRKSLHLPERDPIIVYIGFTKYDQRFFSDSLIELFRMNTCVKLLLLGSRLLQLDKSLQRAGYSDRVIYKAPVSHSAMGTYLSSGNVMVLPYTDREINRARFPNKFGDYLAAGRPIVSNPTGDMPSVFKKHNIGLLAPEDPEMFAHSIQSLLESPAKQRMMGKNARKLAETVYSWKILAGSLETYYLQVLSDHRNSK